MCSCEQGTCPGGCACGCRHTSPPWPQVNECFSRLCDTGDKACQQHYPTHLHVWLPWDTGHGIAVRCQTCGGRKCDMRDCERIRHHTSDQAGGVGHGAQLPPDGVQAIEAWLVKP